MGWGGGKEETDSAAVKSVQPAHARRSEQKDAHERQQNKINTIVHLRNDDAMNIVIGRANVAQTDAFVFDADVDAARRAVVVGATTAEGRRVGGLKLGRQAREELGQLRGVAGPEEAATRLLGQGAQFLLIDAVIV